MHPSYVIRYGTHGKLGEAACRTGPTRGAPRERAAYARGDHVVVETDRGIELAEVLGPVAPSSTPQPDAPYAPHAIVRRAAPGDLARATSLEACRAALYDYWREELARWGLAVELVDVEELLEGGRIVFYVLAEPGDATVRLSQMLALKLPHGFRLENLAADVAAASPQARKCGACGSGQCHAPDEFEPSAAAGAARPKPAEANGHEPRR